MSSGKKHPRSEGKFQFSHINEIRSVICVETLNLLAGKDLTTEKQALECFQLYHGGAGIMGQAEKFMKIKLMEEPSMRFFPDRGCFL